MKVGTIVAGLSVVAACAMACGSSRSSVRGAAAASAAASDAASPSPSPASTGPAKPPERPFANTALDARSMIQSQIDTHMKVLWSCVRDYRTKAGDPHRPISSP